MEEYTKDFNTAISFLCSCSNFVENPEECPCGSRDIYEYYEYEEEPCLICGKEIGHEHVIYKKGDSIICRSCGDKIRNKNNN